MQLESASLDQRCRDKCATDDRSSRRDSTADRGVGKSGPRNSRRIRARSRRLRSPCNLCGPSLARCAETAGIAGYCNSGAEVDRNGREIAGGTRLLLVVAGPARLDFPLQWRCPKLLSPRTGHQRRERRGNLSGTLCRTGMIGATQSGTRCVFQPTNESRFQALAHLRSTSLAPNASVLAVTGIRRRRKSVPSGR